MRILYLHQYFNTSAMAGSTRSFEIGRRLVAAGHSVDMVTSWQEPSDRKDWFITEEAGMRVHWLPVRYSNHMAYSARIGAFLKFARQAARRSTRLPADVIFATSTPLTIAIPAIRAAKRQRIPMVFEVRDLWPELPIAMNALRDPVSRWLARRLERFAYAHSERIVALSPGMKAGIEEAGYPAERIIVVPNGADLELFRRDVQRGSAFRRQYGIDERKVLVGYAGTLGKINDVGYLVRVASELKNQRHLSFVIIGDGQERERIARMAQECAVLGENLIMIPKLPKAQIPEALSAVDIATSLFLPLPAMEANSANKFFDALAAGCSVAINYGGWHAELLERADAGVRLDRKPSVAAQQLQALATNPSRLRTMGDNARRLAETEFSRDNLATQVENVIVSAAKGFAR